MCAGDHLMIAHTGHPGVMLRNLLRQPARSLPGQLYFCQDCSKLS